MIVVSDTSPLTALITVGQPELLPKLFGEVIIPPGVRNELLQGHSQLPSWIRVVPVTDSAAARSFARTVDPGEAEAIQLAKELAANHVLMDDRAGRELARREKLPVIGLLGIVILAKAKGIIPSARSLLVRLESEAGMYLDPILRDRTLTEAGE